ncbi:MAG TPA: proteasome accessory factor PafA2 family protein [Fimbriimonadaceae bacterium]|nr:proteasome accessory factor PafA2 family protein [Fimbriimonadaceae bacterium]
MGRILAGLETEYGLHIEGQGAGEQIDNSASLVRSLPNQRGISVWNYRYESPRADLRGFAVERLNSDPEDAQFDRGRVRVEDAETRSDRLLVSGGRFYNDHGHPEYSTPECWGLQELVAHDALGEVMALEAAQRYAQMSGAKVSLYKNNTDFHGAAYGTHENYLIPRTIPFQELVRALVPILIARTILCGAGKVGAESGDWCDFQLSQRADFFTELASVDTLYRRPILNTRDEPHANPGQWVRLHVISGDANMLPTSTRMKVLCVKLVDALLQVGEAPFWDVTRPTEAFRKVSRGLDGDPRIELATGSWTTSRSILETLFDTSEKFLRLDDETTEAIAIARALLDQLSTDFDAFATKVDWAAKRRLLQLVSDEEGIPWGDRRLQSYDLEYHNIDPEVGLMFALREMGAVEPGAAKAALPTSRAGIRALAVQNYREHVVTGCWRTLTMRRSDGREVELELDPTREVDVEASDFGDVDAFIDFISA